MKRLVSGRLLGSALVVLLAGAAVAYGQQYSISTVAGGAPPLTPATATSTSIGQPRRVALDSSGNVYFTSGNSVFKIAGTTLTLLAGNSRPGFSGDGGPAVSAQLNNPIGLSVDKASNVYVADSVNNRIRRVATDGTISTFAGNGAIGFVGSVGDGGPAVNAQLYLPAGVFVDSNGNVYIADTAHSTIREVTTDGNIKTVAGNGYPSYSGDGYPAIEGNLNHPADVTVDSSGNIYIADTQNASIRKVTASDGLIATFAGNGAVGYSGDSGAATKAGLIEPYSVTLDSSGNLLLAEPPDGRIRKVDKQGNINTVAGNGTLGFAGDNGAASSAQFQLPTGVAMDSSGNLYIADSLNNRIRKVSGTSVSTIAGNGTFSYSGDAGQATRAQLDAPRAVAADTAGNLYIADTGNNAVRKVASGGVISTLAGTGTAGFGGDNAAATSAQLNAPSGIAVDGNGNVYVADTQNARVRKISGSNITTVAGNGTPGFAGDNAAATAAQLNSPLGVAVDAAGNLYIADFGNNVVRRVSTGGTITTVAGNGNQGYSGDGGLATAARLNGPRGVAVDASGNLYIADTLNNRVREVNNGIISTVAGTGIPGTSGEGGAAALAQIVTPGGIAVDSSGTIYITDLSSRVRKIYPGGAIVTIAGSGAVGYSGDGGLATSATLYGPTGLATDSKGNLYIADTGNNAVRLLQSTGTGVTVAAVTNAASNQLGSIAPGEIIVLYGFGMGPAVTVQNNGASGSYGTLLAGTTVYVNGIRAPILYTSATQVSAIVPFGTIGSKAQIYVNYQNQTSAPVQVSVSPASPAIFTADFSGKGPAAAVNVDATGSVNDPSHPADAGNYVTLYVSGGGQTVTPGQDGIPAPGASQLQLPYSATIGGKPAAINYAGAAPGLVAGLVQINMQVPAGLPAGQATVLLQIGGVNAPPVTIYVSGK